jgi:stage II sporulation protein AA (anti-sigma F factor antagonist)
VFRRIRSFLLLEIEGTKEDEAMLIRGAVVDRTMTLELGGEIDHHQVKRLMGEVDSRIDLHLPRQLVLDLSQVSFMDSSGVALLLRAWRRMGELNGTVQVVEVPKQPLRVLRAAGIHKIMSLSGKEEEA